MLQYICLHRMVYLYSQPVCIRYTRGIDKVKFRAVLTTFLSIVSSYNNGCPTGCNSPPGLSLPVNKVALQTPPSTYSYQLSNHDQICLLLIKLCLF